VRGAGEPDAELDAHGMSLGRALCNDHLMASLNAEERIGRSP
jgi:hypothetical protein